MDAALIDAVLKGAAGDVPWVAVVIYLYRENQALHKSLTDSLATQLALFQKVALKTSEGGE